jgi:1,4-alpha-glucan branching enzyme
MEVRNFITFCLLVLLCNDRSFAQERREPSYTIRNGRMFITIGKEIGKARLDSFVGKYDLSDLDLPKILFGKMNTGKLERSGWRIDINDQHRLVVSKMIEGIGQLGDPEKRMALAEDHPNNYDAFPPQNDNLVYGVNRFRGKFPFAVKDSLVTFFLREHPHARQVLLAGSFTNWQNGALPMKHTDSGWVTSVKLGPGKYWYKFIVDGGWTVDHDNDLEENDPSGNTNSVFYVTNVVFNLPGHTDARDAYLAGSFNGWNPGELAMEKGPFGWTIHVYLAEGTYTYKFIADGKWYADPANPEKVPDGQKGFNSVFRRGKPHRFFLDGYTSASSVMLAGDFNGWKPADLAMRKTAKGWELPYTLGPGNYQYKFIVDGKWITDPADPLFVSNRDNHTINSFLIIQPNYTFRLKGYPNAKAVYVAGDFNDWTPDGLKMQRVGDAWVFNVHLSVGKHLYKFIVDDKWMKDPANPLWEDNDNSVLWMENR